LRVLGTEIQNQDSVGMDIVASGHSSLPLKVGVCHFRESANDSSVFDSYFSQPGSSVLPW
jgi:hypothetical protein